MESYSLYEHWYVLYCRKKIIGLVVLFSVIFSVILSFYLPEIYEAKTVFFVPSKPDSLTFFSGVDTLQVTRMQLIPEPRGEIQKAYLGFLKSETLRRKVHEAFPQKAFKR